MRRVIGRIVLLYFSRTSVLSSSQWLTLWLHSLLHGNAYLEPVINFRGGSDGMDFAEIEARGENCTETYWSEEIG
jgi:hypothetical protein